MLDNKGARIRRLSLWFALNLVIFILCYLNYRLQLKHRYLYKTLNVSGRSCGKQLLGSTQPHYQHSIHPLFGTSANNNEFFAPEPSVSPVIHTVAHLMNVINFSKKFDPLLSNLNMAEYRGQNPLQLLVSVPGITGCFLMMILLLMSLSSINMIRSSSFDMFVIFHRLSVVFVILLVLHPSSHILKEQINVDRHNPDVCYERMLLAANRNESNSIAATVGNVTNWSQGQRTKSTALQIDDERAGSRGLRAGVASAAPSSVESNLAPENLENDQIGLLTANAESAKHGQTISNQGESIGSSGTRRAQEGLRLRRHVNNDGTSSGNATANNSKTVVDLKNRDSNEESHQRIKAGETTTTTIRTLSPTNDDGSRHLPSLKANVSESSHYAVVQGPLNLTTSPSMQNHHRQTSQQKPGTRHRLIDNDSDRLCLDSRPLFVAQSSICWYVLSAGLLCYLFDAMLRRLRRSKNTIQLLEARSDCEGNLIELILSSNHKRFVQWLPGQFVYLNCPQIAAHEWHPFTISSMDNGTKQFTLHIKTGGDWTRKLRRELKLEDQQQKTNSMSLFGQSCRGYDRTSLKDENIVKTISTKSSAGFYFRFSSPESNCAKSVGQVANFECYNSRTGQLEVECKKLSSISQDIDHGGANEYIRVDLANHFPQGRRDSTCPYENGISSSYQMQSSSDAFELYIDGPFHSPFERLLEQQVSICIANGVGWTAFSSIFQRIANDLTETVSEIDARAELRSLNCSAEMVRTSVERTKNNCNGSQALFKGKEAGKNPETRLHIMVIVTTIEQLKPFYNIALRYFSCIATDCRISDPSSQLNPVREVKAFITRSTMSDTDVRNFCLQEKLTVCNCNGVLQVNPVFQIHFMKPDFVAYFNAFSGLYSDRKKISVYCCGSYPVKKVVQNTCRDMNKSVRERAKRSSRGCGGPVYSYHEENF